MKSFLFVAAILSSLVSALPKASVGPRPLDCSSIPSTADPNIVNQIYKIALGRGVTDKVMLSMFETAWVESHANDLPCGDQDSVGVFQQRPSQGWGTVAQCEDVTYSTNSYLTPAIAHDQANPGYTAGQLAQSVQISEFPDRYDQAQSIAQSLWDQAKAANGGGGTNPPPPPPSGGCGGVGAWSSSVAYVGGQEVSYGGALWQAKWWTEADVPGGPAGVWTKISNC